MNFGKAGYLWLAGSALILLFSALGFFIKPPYVSVSADGGSVFIYDVSWPVALPCIFFLGMCISIMMIFMGLVKKKGIRAPGLILIMLGGLCILLGNLMQILPGNTFPWDALSGIFFAGLLTVALYQKRLFRMRLLISGSVLLIAFMVFFILAAYLWLAPFTAKITELFPRAARWSIPITAMVFAALSVLVYSGLKQVIEAIFTFKRKKKEELIKKFSSKVSRTLRVSEIMDELLNVITGEIPVKTAGICLEENDIFTLQYSTNQVFEDFLIFSSESPLVNKLKDGEPYFVLDDFRRISLTDPRWEPDMHMIRKNNIRCIMPLKNDGEIAGLILLHSKMKGAAFYNDELIFLETLSSITSIAMKNALLYEQVFREARIDGLTGAYNYRFFVDRIVQHYSTSPDALLSLIYLDIDDFQLYNQLHGTAEGDYILTTLAEIITDIIGENGELFRHSGKVFAVLLPGYDSTKAYAVVQRIRRRLALINDSPERRMIKPVTVSCGITTSPATASNPQEMMDNAGIAAYSAKCAGKGCTNIFREKHPDSDQIAERAMQIVERANIMKGSAYEAYSSSILALTAAVDAKDHYTYSHSQNTARYAIILAAVIGLNDEQIRLVYEAALLHDIGKISIPERILTKTSQLTPEEYETMKEHVNNAINIIRHLPSMDYVIPAAIGHHERWDGTGYPLGIKGKAIPVAARCLAIADTFDAMTADRPYRSGLPVEYAVEQISANAGSQFDPELATVFIGLIRSGEIVVENDPDSLRRKAVRMN